MANDQARLSHKSDVDVTQAADGLRCGTGREALAAGDLGVSKDKVEGCVSGEVQRRIIGYGQRVLNQDLGLIEGHSVEGHSGEPHLLAEAGVEDVEAEHVVGHGGEVERRVVEVGVLDDDGGRRCGGERGADEGDLGVEGGVDELGAVVGQ